MILQVLRNTGWVLCRMSLKLGLSDKVSQFVWGPVSGEEAWEGDVSFPKHHIWGNMKDHWGCQLTTWEMGHLDWKFEGALTGDDKVKRPTVGKPDRKQGEEEMVIGSKDLKYTRCQEIGWGILYMLSLRADINRRSQLGPEAHMKAGWLGSWLMTATRTWLLVGGGESDGIKCHQWEIRLIIRCVKLAEDSVFTDI